jgi:hypothetical protein
VRVQKVFVIGRVEHDAQVAVRLIRIWIGLL